MGNYVDSMLILPVWAMSVFDSVTDGDSSIFTQKRTATPDGGHVVIASTHKNSVSASILDFSNSFGGKVYWRDCDGYGAETVFVHENGKDARCNTISAATYASWK